MGSKGAADPVTAALRDDQEAKLIGFTRTRK
jgi:hypothetical protein